MLFRSSLSLLSFSFSFLVFLFDILVCCTKRSESRPPIITKILCLLFHRSSHCHLLHKYSSLLHLE